MEALLGRVYAYAAAKKLARAWTACNVEIGIQQLRY
jgi:hypothetical protein